MAQVNEQEPFMYNMKIMNKLTELLFLNRIIASQKKIVAPSEVQ